MSDVNDETENHASLLLYLVGELSSSERAAMEQRLANDSRLRSELESLRAMSDETFEALAHLDRVAVMGDGFTASVARRTSRAVTQWHATQMRDVALRPAPHRALFGRRMTMAASVAVLLGGLLAWWGYEAFDSQGPPDKFETVPVAAQFDATPEDTEALAQTYATAMGGSSVDRDGTGLVAAEQELDDLDAARNPGNSLSGMQ